MHLFYSVAQHKWGKKHQVGKMEVFGLRSSIFSLRNRIQSIVHRKNTPNLQSVTLPACYVLLLYGTFSLVVDTSHVSGGVIIVLVGFAGYVFSKDAGCIHAYWDFQREYTQCCSGSGFSATTELRRKLSINSDPSKL